MQELWNTLVTDYLGRLVAPDWGGLIPLIPIGLAGIVGLYLLWLGYRYAAVGPAQRGGRPIVPRAPAGIHMPGPSLAPIFVAGGAAILFLGLALGGAWPWVGGVLTLGALLWWGREAMHDYDHLAAAELLPAVVEKGPPEGIHVPGPSARPFFLAVAMTVLFLGLVFNVTMVIAGVLMLVIVGIQWLRDAGTEYRQAVEGDRLGHLPALPRPRFPRFTTVAFATIFVAAALISLDILPPRNGSAGSGGPAASGAPSPGGGGAPSPAPGGAGAATPLTSPAPGGSPVGGGTVLAVTAKDLGFDVSTLSAPADTPFQIVFTNDDAGVPHNVAIHKDSPTGVEVWRGQTITGTAKATYDVPALPAGSYAFVCSVHPNMIGTLTVQ